MIKPKNNLKLEILGHEVTVKVTDNTSDLLLNGTLCYGIAKPKEGVIYIMEGLTKQEERVTFYHEILHYIDFLLHNEEFKYDEDTVNVLARGLSTLRIIKK